LIQVFRHQLTAWIFRGVYVADRATVLERTGVLNMAALGATRLRELNPLIGATLAAAACGVGREPKSGIARQ
tara:strand:- start:361 stop:576 length:216 start_codon:yes stop_codon:yes gene_type:complete